MLRFWFFSVALILLVCFVSAPNAGVYSWVDENGVRHFSNTGGSEGADERSETETAPPTSAKIKPGNARSDRVRRAIQKNRAIKGRKASIGETALRKARREKRARRQVAAERGEKVKNESCARTQQRIDDLRRQGWQNYDAPGIHTPCTKGDADRRRDCLNQRADNRKAAWEKELKKEEWTYNRFCK